MATFPSRRRAAIPLAGVPSVHGDEKGPTDTDVVPDRTRTDATVDAIEAFPRRH